MVLQCVGDCIEVVRIRKSWIGEEMLSEASLEEDELDLTVLLKQQGLTLILVIFEKDFDDSDDVLDLVIVEGVVLIVLIEEVLMVMV